MDLNTALAKLASQYMGSEEVDISSAVRDIITEACHIAAKHGLDVEDRVQAGLAVFKEEVGNKADWVRNLQAGDEVIVITGDALPATVRIQSIEYIGEVARIVSTSGERYECPIDELG